MYPEDACVQMELLGHNFFVFVNAETDQVNNIYLICLCINKYKEVNAETDQVNVVYKRKGNTYGLIEPEF